MAGVASRQTKRARHVVSARFHAPFSIVYRYFDGTRGATQSMPTVTYAHVGRACLRRLMPLLAGR